MERLLWVCAGGALGSGLRYVLSGWLTQAAGGRFPIGTLAVNVLGSLAIGLIMQLGLSTSAIPPLVRITLTTGVLGGFTTYSTFSYETASYLGEGAFGLAGVNIVVTLVGCVGGCLLGLAAGKALVGV